MLLKSLQPSPLTASLQSSPVFSVHFCTALPIFSPLTWRPHGQCDPAVTMVTFSKYRFYLLISFAYAAFSQAIVCAVSQHRQSPGTTVFLKLRGPITVSVTPWHSSHCFLRTCRSFSEHHSFCFSEGSSAAPITCILDCWIDIQRPEQCF